MMLRILAILATSFCCAQAQVPRAFVESNCYDCHTGEEADAGLDLKSLSENLSDGRAFKTWTRVVDRVHSGEMPPPDSSDLSKVDRQQFVQRTSSWLKQFQSRDFAERGRVRGKRLTNLQLERTLHDLLGIDIPLANGLPDEPRTDGFTTVADGQPMSHFQLQNHLTLVDTALDEAFRRMERPEDLQPRKLFPKRLVRRNARRRCREPEMRNGKAVVWTGRTTYYGRLPVVRAREQGWFRFTIRASALKKPKDRGVWCSVRTGQCVSSAPQLDWVTAFEATEKPQEWTFEAWLPEDHMLEIRPADATLKQARFAGGQIGTGEGEPQNVPGLAIHWLEVQRIHKGPNSDAIRRRLLGDTSEPAEERLQRLITAFANRAFRRPVNDDVVKPYVEIAKAELEAGGTSESALRVGYRSVLCSPRFLYLNETVGPLDDHAFASRLSYFLWNTMPDAQLLELAANGTLQKPSVMKQQIARMLDDDRGREFVTDLAHQWLDLSEIDFTQPDRRRHPDFDVVIQNSMVEETHAFLNAMLSEDLSVAHLIDSDFTFLNSRLAAFYGIPDVSGDNLRRVKLDPLTNRGGLLTQGAILKVTANGTTTSPVVRGVWVAERLLGQQIPPPPENIPAIEPDIRGAKTIREMLAKHRSDTSCASCHVKIDPPGFALENFDPAGKWRETYFHRNRRRRQKIDPSYTLAGGEPFKNIREFKKLIVSKPEKLAHNVAEKLVTYGTGAPVAFADREHLEEIVKQAADSNYGFRSLLHAVVESPLFRNK